MNICTKIGVCCFYVIAVILSLIGLASFSLGKNFLLLKIINNYLI